MKILSIIIGIFLLFIVGFFAFNSYIYNQKQGDSSTMQNTTSSDNLETQEGSIQIIPISHASMVLRIADQVIYNDPVGVEAFKNQQEPNIILISDIHGDHFNPETISAVSKENTTIIVPQVVADELPKDILGKIVVLKNGEKTTIDATEIEAVPMYNIPQSESAYHTKGRGNGYIISGEGERIYIAGDTSVTPEMKALKDISIAFVPMNLPYTMTEEEAAEGVLSFKPRVVHPYHYRGSDVQKFQQIVESKDPNIKVDLLNFYPN